MPVLVVNGDSDPMILPRYSWPDPEGADPDLSDAAHGSLFQHHAQFAGDVDVLLAEVR
jgi:hypothetical protein